MAKIRSISPSTQRVKAHPTEVDCQFAVVHDKGGSKILHLSTFGSDNRVSAPKSSQSIQLDHPMAEQLVELLIDTFKLAPGGSTDIVWSRSGPRVTLDLEEQINAPTEQSPVPIKDDTEPGPVETTMNSKVALVIGGDQFVNQYSQFRPRFAPLTIGLLLTLLLEANGRASFGEVAAVLGVRPARVRQSVAVLSQVINEDGASIMSENGSEVILNSSLLFEQFRVH